MVALIVLGCSSSRVVRGERFVVHGHETRDSVVVGTMEAVRDSVVERTTVTIQTSEAGDTVMRSVVTERDRYRDRSRADRAMTKNVIRTDTVVIEKRDSVSISERSNAKGRDSPFERSLRLILWIILGLIALVVVLRFRS